METFRGIPLHPLVIHVVVASVPAAALLAIGFAVLPHWRWALRWPMALLALVALGSTLVAVKSGQALLPTFQSSPLAQRHAALGHQFRWICVAFAAVTVVSAFVLGGRTALASGRGSWRAVGGRAVQTVTAVAVVLMSVAALVQVARTGDAGAQAAWHGVQIQHSAPALKTQR